MIALISGNELLEIVKQVTDIYRYEFEHLKDENSLSNTKKYKHIIIDSEYINLGISEIIKLKDKFKSNIILITDENIYLKNQEILEENNITDVILSDNKNVIKKQLISILFNPNNKENKPYILKNKKDISQENIPPPKEPNQAIINAKARQMFRQRQNRLKKKYKVATDKVLVVEKSNMLKFSVNTLVKVVRLLLNILLFILASIGLLALVYPEPREDLYKIMIEVVNQIKTFIS